MPPSQLIPTSDQCTDDLSWSILDAKGAPKTCTDWSGWVCSEVSKQWGWNATQLAEIEAHCPFTCSKCNPVLPEGVNRVYMYRAIENSFYGLANADAADVGGVLSYLHVEVIPTELGSSPTNCWRKFNITQVLRLEVFMKNDHYITQDWVRPPTSTDPHNYQWRKFSNYRSLDSAKCTQPHCMDGTIPGPDAGYLLQGYNVGCQDRNMVIADTQYDPAVWYSLPGPCPEQDWQHKTAACSKEHPGGQELNLTLPLGLPTSTWSYRGAGTVRIDDLSGITAKYGSYEKMCKMGLPEFNRSGGGVPFWQDPMNITRNKMRGKALEEAFDEKYPFFPASANDTATPCDGGWGCAVVGTPTKCQGPNGQGYLCNHITKACEPSLDPAAINLTNCKAACGDPAPPTPVGKGGFTCDPATWTCVKAHSTAVSQQQCSDSCREGGGAVYGCNANIGLCEQVLPGTAGCNSFPICSQSCGKWSMPLVEEM